MGAVADAVVGVQPNHPAGLFPPPLIDNEKYTKAGNYNGGRLIVGVWSSLVDWASFKEGVHRHRFFSGTSNQPRIVQDHVRKRAVIDQRIWATAQQGSVGMALWEIELIPVGGFLFGQTNVWMGDALIVADAFRRQPEGRSYVYTFQSPLVIERVNAAWEYPPKVEFLCEQPSSLSVIMRGYLLKNKWGT